MVRLAGTLCLIAATASAAATRQPEVLVSVAASLSEVMRQVARAYEGRTGMRVTVNTGASNTLARQIAAGAAVDLFISADEAQMDAIGDAVVTGTRVDLVSNQLAIAVPADRPRTLRSARELTDPTFKRIALGDPAAVPAGIYAKAYLAKLGVWPAIARKVVPSASVRLALAAVENGAADAAIVYRTDVATARRAKLALAIPVGEGPRIVYPAAVVRTGRNRGAAAQLLAWLQGTEAARLFRAAGFIHLSGDVRLKAEAPIPSAHSIWWRPSSAGSFSSAARAD